MATRNSRTTTRRTKPQQPAAKPQDLQQQSIAPPDPENLSGNIAKALAICLLISGDRASEETIRDAAEVAVELLVAAKEEFQRYDAIARAGGGEK